MEKLNIAELLKDCPKGTKLWSDIHGECEYVGNSKDEHPLLINTHTKRGEADEVSFAADGLWNIAYEGLCLLWPSKDHRTWDDWDEYKTNCLPKPEKPKTYKKACEILGIVCDKIVFPWDYLHILGKAWNQMDGAVNNTWSGYYPIVNPHDVTCGRLYSDCIGIPATFQDEETAIKFGEEFQDLYLKLQ